MILIRGDHDGYSVQLRLIAGVICVAELHLDLHVRVHALAHAHTHGHAVCAPSHHFSLFKLRILGYPTGQGTASTTPPINGKRCGVCLSGV